MGIGLGIVAAGTLNGLTGDWRTMPIAITVVLATCVAVAHGLRSGSR